MKRYREYKTTDIKWIGSYPRSWFLKKIKEVAPFVNRGTTPDYVKEGTMVVNQATFSKGSWDISDVRYSSVNPNMARGKVKKNDVLIASTGGGVLGKVFWFQEEGTYIADSHVTIIRTDDNFNSKYLFYLLEPNYDLINAVLAKGSTNQTELQRQWLRDFFIPVPSKDEQDQIVRYLDWKTSEMNHFINQKKQIKNLEELKWTRIDHLITKGLSTCSMKDSGVEWIGEIPEHWNIDTIKQHFRIKKRIAGEEGYEVLSITQQGIKVKDISTNEGQMAQSYANYQFVYSGEFAMNHMDLITGFVDISKHSGVTSPDYRVFSLEDKEHCNPEFYLKVFQIAYKRRIFYKFGKGAASQGRWRLPKDAFLGFSIQVPPREEQEKIIKECNRVEDTINKLIEGTKKEISLIEELKTKLISDAVTGQIDVRDVVIPEYITEDEISDDSMDEADEVISDED